MGKRKTENKFNVRELRQIEQQMRDGRFETVTRLREALGVDAPDFDTAVKIRDLGQFLCTTCLALQTMPMVIEAATLSGAPQSVPHLDRLEELKVAK